MHRLEYANAPTANAAQPHNRRVLVVDDNPEIHADFERTLCPRSTSSPVDEQELDLLKAMLLGATSETSPAGKVRFELDHAHQGAQALEMVDAAADAGQPYALAFVDVRMPPGMDGVQTTAALWRKHPDLEVVLCSAHSDYSWDEILNSVGQTDRLLMIKKPFAATTVQQMALSLTTKWSLRRRAELTISDLELEVRKRTAQLEAVVARLDQLKTQAEEDARVRRGLLLRVSAELQGPLDGIRGMSRRLLDTGLAEEQRQLARTIHSSADHLVSMMEDVLALSRLEGQAPAAKPVDVRAVLDKVIGLAGAEARVRGLRLSSGCDPLLPAQIVGDAARLERVLSSLIRSALQRAPREVGVRALLAAPGEQGPLLRFEITDDGPGIPPADLERVARSLDADVEPSGALPGLCVGQGLVSLLGGQIGVQNLPGRGARLWFTLGSGKAPPR